MNMKLFTGYCLIVLLMLGGCSRSVTRIASSTQTDLSGRWNDTDSRLTANVMMEQMFGNLGSQWASEFQQRNQRRPVIIVGLVSNKSHEHISAEIFIKDLENAIIRNGSIRLVEAGDNRNELRLERADQQDFASLETAKSWGRELGADFMLQGTINSIVDGYRRNQAIYYQIDLRLTNIETNEVTWVGNNEIKKMVRN